MSKRAWLFAWVLCALVPVGAAWGDDYTWVGGTGGNWSVLTNWEVGGGTPSTLPGATDNVLFQHSGNEVTYTVTIDVSPSVANFTVSDRGWWVFNDNGGGEVLTISDSLDYNVTVRPDRSACGIFNIKLSGGMGFQGLDGTVRLANAGNDFTGNLTRVGGSGYYGADRLRLSADGVLGSGAKTLTVNGGAVTFEADQTLAAGQQIIVNAGGEIWTGAATLSCAMTMNDGSLLTTGESGPSTDVSSTLTISGTVEVNRNQRNDSNITLSGLIQDAAKGPGKLLFSSFRGQRNFYVTGADNTYSGGTDITDFDVWANAENCLGTGTAYIYDNGILHLGAGQTAPIVLQASGSIQNNAGTLTAHVIAEDGTALLAGGTWNGTFTLQGEFAMVQSNPMTVNSVIQDAAKASGRLLIQGVRTDEPYGREIALAGANTYSGGTDVQGGTAVAKAAGCLSSGTVEIGGGKLRTEAEGSLTSPAAVIVQTDGIIDFGSAEAALVTVNSGGAILHTASQTYVYSEAGQNIDLQAGAILDVSVPTLPTLGEIGGGDGGHGVYLGTDTTDSGDGLAVDYTVAGGNPFGPTGSDTDVFRGLASINHYYSAVRFTGTVESTEHVEFYVANAGMQLDDGLAMNVDADAKGADTDTYHVRLHGSGVVDFEGDGTGPHAGNFTTVDVDAGTTLRPRNDNVLSGKAVNVHGYLNTEACQSGALGGATITVHAGGIAQIRGPNQGPILTSTTGLLLIKTGAGIGFGSRYNTDGLSIGTHPTEFELHSQVYIDRGNDRGTGPWPGAGKADYVCYGRTDGIRTGTHDIILGDETRLTYDAGDVTNLDENGTPVLRLDTANGATQGRIAAPGGGTFKIDIPINFGTGKLLAGALGTFTVLYNPTGDANGPPTTWLNITQDGTVSLDKDSNVIGSIEVVAGTLRSDNTARLGGATEIAVNSGATLRLDFNNPTLAVQLSGSGEALIGDNGSGASTLTLTPTWDGANLTQASIAPGSSTGELTVTGNLTFGKVDAGGEWSYGQLIVDIEGHGGNHDRAAVSGNASIGDAELVVNLPLPSGVLNPALVNADVLTTGGTLSGVFASVVRGDASDSHWDIGLDDVAYAKGAVNVVLDADDWTGLGGDADLNGVVNYLDLGVLATNYDLTGLGWGDGDFNFDGKVDYMDLGILATNYDLTEGGGGAPVPAPAALALLGFGAVGLLRRRRLR